MQTKPLGVGRRVDVEEGVGLDHRRPLGLVDHVVVDDVEQLVEGTDAPDDQALGGEQRIGAVAGTQRVVDTGATSGADMCMGLLASARSFLLTYDEAETA